MFDDDNGARYRKLEQVMIEVENSCSKEKSDNNKNNI